MEPVRIPCPECGKSLKVKNAKLLGKKVKCPGCSHPFVLTPPQPEEDLVEFEMAGAPAAQKPAAAEEPATGTAARWVPDDVDTLPAAGSATATATNASQPAPTVVTDDPPQLYGDRDAGGVGRMKELQRKNRQRRKMAILFGVVTAVAIGGTWFGISTYNASVRAQEQARLQAEADAKAPKRDRVFLAGKEAQKENLALAEKFDPTRGEPIDMRFLPDGAGVVFHLRPADIKATNAGNEILAGIDPVWKWAEEKIKANVGAFPLDQVEELTMCVYMLSKSADPIVCSVVRFTGPLPKSELINTIFEEKLQDVPEIWTGGDWAYMLQDENKTLAICPNDPIYIEEMAGATGVVTSEAVPGVKDVIKYTDRARHFTIVFRPADVNIYKDQLLDDMVKPAADVLVRWFGEDVDGLAWSFHATDKFHSEIIMQPRRASVTDRLLSANRLQKDVRDRLDTMPDQVYSMVRYMEPETVGRQQIVGRFPAMMKAYSVGTLGGSDEDHVKLTTIIDNDRAAPNLAVGALLTWYESTRTDFDKTLEPVDPTGGLPQLVVDRLKQVKIEAEFNGVAMDEVYGYIGDETKVTIYLDGDALKDAGFTKVMRQTMSLGVVPAIKAIENIVQRYQEPNKSMALVIDEKQQRAVITTAKFAEQRGETIYKFE